MNAKLIVLVGVLATIEPMQSSAPCLHWELLNNQLRSAWQFLFDVTEDGKEDIFAIHYSPNILYAIDSNGQYISGFPTPLTPEPDNFNVIGVFKIRSKNVLQIQSSPLNDRNWIISFFGDEPQPRWIRNQRFPSIWIPTTIPSGDFQYVNATWYKGVKFDVLDENLSVISARNKSDGFDYTNNQPQWWCNFSLGDDLRYDNIICTKNNLGFELSAFDCNFSIVNSFTSIFPGTANLTRFLIGNFSGNEKTWVGVKWFDTASQIGSFTVFSVDRQTIHTWQLSSMALLPIPADFDGDNIIEWIIPTNDGNITIYDMNGSILPGWPVSVPGAGNWDMAVADVNNDKELEILVSVPYGPYYGFDRFGRSLPGFPIYTGSPQLSGTPMLSDVELDGYLDLFVQDKRAFYRLAVLCNPYTPQRLVWPTERHDNWRSGVYFAAPTNLKVEEGGPGEVLLTWNRSREPYWKGCKVWYAKWADVRQNPAPDGRHDPYTGVEADQGPAPIVIPRQNLADQLHPSLVLTGLTPGETYVFSVNSTSPWLQESPFSKEVVVTLTGPTPRPTATPTDSPEPTATATPSGAPSWTPTATGTATLTPVPTSTPSPTPGPHIPRVLLAGYWDSSLGFGRPGAVRAIALTSAVEPSSAPAVSLYTVEGGLLVGLTDTGGWLPDGPFDGLYCWESPVTAVPSPLGRIPLEIRSTLDASPEPHFWPYLTVNQ